jgi:hypothetical protein
MYDYTETYQHCDKILDFIVSRGGRIMRSDLNEILPKDSKTHVALQHLLEDKCIQEYPKGSSYYDIIPNGTRIQGNGGYKEEFNRKRLADELKQKIDQSILDTNDSVDKTNKSVRDTNTIQKWALGGTLFVAIIGAIFQGLTYKLEKTNKTKETEALRDSIVLIQERIRQLSNDPVSHRTQEISLDDSTKTNVDTKTATPNKTE